MKRKLAPGSDFSSKKVQQHMSRDENSTRDAQCADGLVCHAFPERGFIRQHDVAQHRHKVEGKRGGGVVEVLTQGKPSFRRSRLDNMGAAAPMVYRTNEQAAKALLECET